MKTAMQRLIANLETMGITFPQGIQQTFLSIEKEQIIKAHIDGFDHIVAGFKKQEFAEQYYNETYNKNES